MLRGPITIESATVVAGNPDAANSSSSRSSQSSLCSPYSICCALRSTGDSSVIGSSVDRA